MCVSFHSYTQTYNTVVTENEANESMGNVFYSLPDYRPLSNVVKNDLLLSPLNFNIDARPRIDDVQVLDIEWNADKTHYRIKFNVFHNSNLVNILTEEEYSAIARYQFIENPKIASGVSDWIYKGGYGWLTFYCENDFGRDEYILEFEPGAEHWYRWESSLSNSSLIIYDHDNLSNNHDIRINAYDLNGNLIGNYNSIDQLSIDNYKGLVILQILRDHKILKTIKYLAK